MDTKENNNPVQRETEAEDAGDNRLEAEPEADLQGRQFKGAFGWNQEH